MDDAELERLAVRELLQEAEAKSTTSCTAREKHNNPAIRTNKYFLGRTLNSAIAHNKRKEDRTQKNCRNKLKALEERRRKRLQNEFKAKKTSRSSSKHFESVSESISSSEDDEPVNKEVQKTVCCHSSKSKTERRNLHREKVSKLVEEQRNKYAQEEYYSQYFDHLAAYALASKSYYQVGKWLCYQALLAGSTEYSERPIWGDFFDFRRLEHFHAVDNDPICLSSCNDSDSLSNCELNLSEDSDSLIALDHCLNNHTESAALPEDAVECQLIDEELSCLQSTPLAATTIELSDTSDEENANTNTKICVSIDLTDD